MKDSSGEKDKTSCYLKDSLELKLAVVSCQGSYIASDISNSPSERHAELVSASPRITPYDWCDPETSSG